MRGLNKAQIIGRLGAEPQITTTAAGLAICNISVATSEQWRDNNGELREQTEWHRITMFGKLAEVGGKYLKKGSTVYVEGKLKTQKYTDQNGIERYSTSIHAEQMQMLDSKAPDNGISQETAQAANLSPVAPAPTVAAPEPAMPKPVKAKAKAASKAKAKADVNVQVVEEDEPIPFT